MKTEIIERQDTQVQRSDGDSIMHIIQNASTDPNFDTNKLEKLLDLYERVESRNAESQFNAAMASMQCDLPSIAERGTGHNKVTYATFEDINDVVKPIMQRHGFAITFKVEHVSGSVSITGILMHMGGHREQTTMLLPSDTTGSKNAVQAVGSSVSYGKRYVMSALLNLTTRGEDDDGYGAVPSAVITSVQANHIIKLLAGCSKETADNIESHYGGVNNIPKKHYDAMLARLAKESAQVKREAISADNS